MASTKEVAERGERALAQERDRLEALTAAYDKLEQAGTAFKAYTASLQKTLGEVEGTLEETQGALKDALHKARESELLVSLLKSRNERLAAQVRGLGAKPNENGNGEAEKVEASLNGGGP